MGPEGPAGSRAGRSKVPRHWKDCEAPGPASERGDSSGPRGTPLPPPPDSPSQLRLVGVSRSHLLGISLLKETSHSISWTTLGTLVRGSRVPGGHMHTCTCMSLETGTYACVCI